PRRQAHLYRRGKKNFILVILLAEFTDLALIRWGRRRLRSVDCPAIWEVTRHCGICRDTELTHLVNRRCVAHAQADRPRRALRAIRRTRRTNKRDQNLVAGTRNPRIARHNAEYAGCALTSSACPAF